MEATQYVLSSKTDNLGEKNILDGSSRKEKGMSKNLFLPNLFSEKKEILVVFLFIQHQILKAQNERPQKF